MYSYDLMVIFKAGTDERKVEALLREFVEPVGAKMSDTQVLGKKQFAYPINKQTEGIYVTATLADKPVTQAALQASQKQHSDVLRFLLTTKDN